MRNAMPEQCPQLCAGCICNVRTYVRTNGDPTYRQQKMCSYVTRASKDLISLISNHGTRRQERAMTDPDDPGPLDDYDPPDIDGRQPP